MPVTFSTSAASELVAAIAPTAPRQMRRVVSSDIATFLANTHVLFPQTSVIRKSPHETHLMPFPPLSMPELPGFRGGDYRRTSHDFDQRIAGDPLNGHAGAGGSFPGAEV